MTFPETFAKLHNTYERKAMRMLLKEFQALGKKLPYEILTPENAEGIIKLTLNEAGLEKALFKIHLTIGKSYGNLEARRYRKFREQKKFKPLPLFNEAFQLFLINYFQTEGGNQITLLTETYVSAVVEEIVKSKVENETIIQMRDRIFRTVNKPNFYKWQALRIARTETTFAMNSAAMVSSDVSGVVMEKVWYTYRDSRVRDTHRAMEGKVLPTNELYELPSGVKMRFPGDKSAIGRSKDVASDLVNCRCSVSHRAKLDENGLFIFTDNNNIAKVDKYANLHPEAQKFLKENNIDLDEKFVKYIPKDLPIKYTDGGSQFVFGDGVYINKKHLTINNRVVYHEIGHAIDINNLNINKSRKITNALPKAINNDKELTDLHNKLFQLHKNGDDETKNYVNALADTIMGFNPNFGWGHDKKYMKKYGKLEIVAHAFEFKFMGNPIAKQMTPELYDNLIKLIDGYIK